MSERNDILSKEQLLRIERNRQLAKERLLAKRNVFNPVSGNSEKNGFPAEKKLRFNDPRMQPTVDPMQSSSYSCSKTPALSKPVLYNSDLQKQYFPKPEVKNNSVGADRRPNKQGKCHALSKGCHSGLPHSKQKIKANFVVLSRETFQVDVPYDAQVNALFKQMSNKLYDIKTATWSFSIGDYNSLVDAMKKECPYVELNLIPKPVIALLQCSFFSARPKCASGGAATTSRDASGNKCVRGNILERPPPSMVDWSRVEQTLVETLMQFQKEGVSYCIRRGGRVMIADDMGLGKTLQAIAVMSYYREDWPLLVICPSSVRLTWSEAFKRWIPSLKESRINVVLSTQDVEFCHDVCIISYDLAVRMEKQLKEQKFRAVVADESHFLKNSKTARCKAVAPIVKSAKRALLLSGTPALSRPIELYTQINMLDRNFQSITFAQFGIRYCNGVKNHFGWNFGGASNMAELQLYMEESFMIRRMKSEVLSELPTKRRQMVLLDLTTTSRKGKEWKDMKADLDKAGTLKGMDRNNAVFPLYEKTGRLKLPAVKRYILDLLEGRRKFIVFGHHRIVLDSVCELLKEQGHKHIRIDGKTAPEIRQSLCDEFQHDQECLVAVLSITTANAGLTLTAASTVVFVELFWNPGILVQAEDRAYRIGQHNSVNIHYLVACGTVDDFIWPLIQVKLKVLCQAGLAKDDFSKTDSTSVKHASHQPTLFECLGGGELMKEDGGGSTSDDKGSLKEDAAVGLEASAKTSTKPHLDVSNWFDKLTDEDFNSMDTLLTESDIL